MVEKQLRDVVQSSYQGDLKIAIVAFLRLHEKYGWKEQLLKRYKLIIQPFEQGDAPGESTWDLLSQLTGTVEGPADWASEIDRYLYGTPKRNHDA